MSIFPMRKCIFLIVLVHLIYFTRICASATQKISPAVGFRHYGPEEGLTCKTVYSMVQDQNGFIWIGTDQGAFSFDGKNFNHYTKQDGLADNEVFGVFQDSKGRIWFQTFNGYPSFWKNGVIHNRFNTPFLKNAYAGSIVITSYEDRKGRIWFGTQQAGFILIENDSARHITFPDQNQVLRSPDVLEDSHGAIWAIRNSKMYPLFANQFKDSIPLIAPFSARCGWHKAGSLDLIYFSPRGIYQISDLASSCYIKKDVLPAVSVSVNVVAVENRLWVCTSGSGCMEYTDGKLTNRYFANSNVNFFLLDREGNKWFSTMNEGLYMIPAGYENVINYDRTSGLSGSKIISVAVDEAQSIWLGYDNGTVDRISGAERSSYTLRRSNEQSFIRIQSLVMDSGILAGTDIGIFAIQNEKITFIPFSRNANEDPYYSVKQLIKLRHDSIYATYSFNFLRLMKDVKGFFIHEELDSLARTFSMTRYNGHLIFSGMNGLMEYIPGKSCSRFVTDVDFSDARIVDMKPDPAGLLLLSTSGNGLYVLKKNKLMQHFSEMNGLSDENCNRILMDGGTCYLGTANGLNILEKKNDEYRLVKVLTSRDGLLSNSINDISVDNDKIYLATDNGLTILPKKIAPFEPYQAKVIITEILTDSMLNFPTADYQFQYNIPRLRARFSYPVFSPVHETQVQYRLIHLPANDSKWVTAKNNEVEFSSLPPGSYRLELKPDLPGYNDEQVTRLHFDIAPLWWQTAGSKAAMGIGFIGLVIFVVRRIESKRYESRMKEQTAIETERSRIASDMHDDIGSDLTQINMWSNILASTHTKDLAIAEKIARSSGDVLEKMDQIIWALNPSHDQATHLVSYLHECASQYLESTEIDFQFEEQNDIPEIKISTTLRRNVFLILKELLHNVVKHSHAKKAVLCISYHKPLLIISLTDDGSGFDAGKQTSGLGLTTMQARSREIQAVFVIDSKPGAGTQAEIKIKL